MRHDVVDEVMHGLTGDRASPTRIHPRLRVIDYLRKHAVELVERMKVDQSKILEYTEHALRRGTDWWLLTDEKTSKKGQLRASIVHTNTTVDGRTVVRTRRVNADEDVKEIVRMVDLLMTKFPRQISLLGDLLDQVAELLIESGTLGAWDEAVQIGWNACIACENSQVDERKGSH